MLAVELRSEKSRGLAKNQVRSGQLPILRFELQNPLPISDLLPLPGGLVTARTGPAGT